MSSATLRADWRAVLFGVAVLFVAYRCAVGGDGTSGLAREPEAEPARVEELAKEKVEGSTYEELNGSADCTEDCSGHDAGFEWAKERGLTDESECEGSRASFLAGCEAYATALSEARDDAEDEALEEARAEQE